MRTRLAVVLVAVLGGVGFGSGRLVAAAIGTPPSAAPLLVRGVGPELVEYFDPACPASRTFHRRLVEVLGVAPGVRHVVIPVAVDRPSSGPAAADLLCAMDRDAAWRAIDAWSVDGPDVSVAAALDARRVSTCASRVEAATRTTATLASDRTIGAPVVVLEGVAYSGLAELPTLEAALAAAEE